MSEVRFSLFVLGVWLKLVLEVLLPSWEPIQLKEVSRIALVLIRELRNQMGADSLMYFALVRFSSFLENDAGLEGNKLARSGWTLNCRLELFHSSVQSGGLPSNVALINSFDFSSDRAARHE